MHVTNITSTGVGASRVVTEAVELSLMSAFSFPAASARDSENNTNQDTETSCNGLFFWVADFCANCEIFN